MFTSESVTFSPSLVHFNGAKTCILENLNIEMDLPQQASELQMWGGGGGGGYLG